MSNQPNRDKDSLDSLRQSAGSPQKPQKPPTRRPAVSQDARPPSRQSAQIEARAGRALQRDYWTSLIETPIGKFSLRSLIILGVGLVATCLILALSAQFIITSAGSDNELQALPTTDAQTVMQHIHANFSGDKSPEFTQFFPSLEEVWNFNSAFQFQWTDADGDVHIVMVASYPNSDAQVIDYVAATANRSTAGLPEVRFRSEGVRADHRNLPQFDGEWRAFRISNITVYLSAGTSLAAQQEIMSHTVSIVGAGHRDAIPTATPRP